MVEVEKFFPHFIEDLIETNWGKKTGWFKKRINFESYREGFFDAFRELDLIQIEKGKLYD